MAQTSRNRLLGGFVLLLALAVLGIFSITSMLPPTVVPASAPAAEFSAERAYQHVERIGARVHPAGSAPADEVREYITATLTQSGLKPEIQDAIGADGALGPPFAMAHVRNVVAVVHGAPATDTSPTGRVVLMAHYDSVQTSFGGNDDGAGVATLLETARAMAQGPRPVNDLVFLFTDAEEACLCGAEAFVGQHQLARDGGVALNFESRGSGGPAIMFETSRGNANVVGVYGGTVPFPVATSVAVEVYRILPNDTDFSPFRESGRFTGLNSAYIDGSAVYHTPEDKPSYMDQSSLQQHGANALALARSFGSEDIGTLSQRAGNDSTYFPAIGVLLRYPGWLVWPLAALSVFAVGGLAWAARRRQLASWPRIAAGFGLATLPLILAPVAAQLLWALLVALRPGYGNMMDPWWPGWFRACVCTLVATILLAWYGLLRRRQGPWPLAVGAFGWLAVLGVVLAAVAPGGSYLATLPAFAGAVGGCVVVSTRRTWLRVLALGLAGAVAVVVLAPAAFLFFPALGLETGAAAALILVMLGFALLPVVELFYPELPGQSSTVKPIQPEPRRRRWVAAPAFAAGVLAAVFLGTGLAVDHFDTLHPAPEELSYALDTDTGQAVWVSADAHLGDWVSQYVAGHDDGINATFGLYRNGVATGAAQPAALPPPQLTVVSDSTSGSARLLTVTIKPQRAVRLVYLDLPDATVLRASIEGRPVPDEALAGRLGVVFHAPPTGGITVELELAETAASSISPTRIRVMDGSDGLDGLPGFVPRPDGVGVGLSHSSELVVVAKTYLI